MRIPYIRALLFITLALLVSNVLAETLHAHVSAVLDGDTIIVSDQYKQQYHVRLQGIDAPEKTQAYGLISKRALQTRINKQTVDIVWHEHDQYGRILGQVFMEDEDINLSQLKRGMAWFYRPFAGEGTQINTAQYQTEADNAQTEKLGLWQRENPLPPWKFRKQHPYQKSVSPQKLD